MNGEQILKERLSRNWEQVETASRLKVSQPYLSLIEAGKRPVTKSVARRAINLFDLPPTALPIENETEPANIKSPDYLVSQLANLGYGKFSHFKKKSKKINPAIILLSALKSDDLESRIVEALPWLVCKFPQMDWSQVIKSAKISDAQNRLGYILSLAYEKVRTETDKEKESFFKELLSDLEKSRLFCEDSFQRQNLTRSEKEWLKNNRPRNAKFWRVLSNLKAEHLAF